MADVIVRIIKLTEKSCQTWPQLTLLVVYALRWSICFTPVRGNTLKLQRLELLDCFRLSVFQVRWFFGFNFLVGWYDNQLVSLFGKFNVTYRRFDGFEYLLQQDRNKSLGEPKGLSYNVQISASSLFIWPLVFVCDNFKKI